MIKNPKTCWRYAIQTEHLREPSESYEVLQTLLKDPTLNYREISEQKGIGYDKVREWSVKYFYRDRVRAYQEELSEQLFTAVTNHKKAVIHGATDRVDKEEAVLKNDLYRVVKRNREITQLEIDDESVPEYVEEHYHALKKQYNEDSLTHLRKAKALQDIAITPTTFTENEITEYENNIKELNDALRGVKDEYRDH